MSTLIINEIFYSIQGETSRSGLPTTFVRLTGCPLRCSYCDTQYAFKDGSKKSFDEIIREINNNKTMASYDPEGQAKKAKYVTNHKRDWVHVKDVCKAIRYLAESDITGPVPVGNGESVSVRALANAFGQGDLPVVTDTPGEREDNVADITILKNLGWFPTINIFDTI